MTNSSIMGSEAGLMLLAEEFDFMASKQVLRILLALSQRGPLTQPEIIKLGLGRPYRIKALLAYLVEDGKIVKVKRSFSSKKPFEPPQTFNHYFCSDEFIPAALTEVMHVLQRSHQAYADGFKRLRMELKPMP